MANGGGLSQLIRDEIISIYVGANVILGSLVELGVHLTKEQIGASLVIANVVLGPIVRHYTNTTPSTAATVKAVEQVRGELVAAAQAEQVGEAVARQAAVPPVE